jgi:uncharacterized protein YbaR (Trm112 family)
MIPQDLLDILRCPHCASTATRHPGEDPGQLTLVRNAWLVCQETDCGRKYPIIDEIPKMLVEEGNRWSTTPVEQLPAPPPAK